MPEKTQTAPETVTVETAPAKSKNFELLELIATQEVGLQQGFTRQLVEVEIERARFDQQARLAVAFARSGMFAEIKGKSESEALACAQAKIEMGRSWGMTPGDAMQFVYFVNGRPAVMNEYYAGAMQRAGYWWDILWHTAGQTKEVVGCTLFLKVKDPESPTGWRRVKDEEGKDKSASFTSEDAKKAKLDTKDGPWKAWAQDMYYWRAMARLRKFYIPNILGGALMAAEAADLDAIVDETERRADRSPIAAPTRKEAAPEPERISQEQVYELNEALQGWEQRQVIALMKQFGVNTLEDLTPEQYGLFLKEATRSDAD